MHRPTMLHIAKRKRKESLFPQVFLNAVAELADLAFVENGDELDNAELTRLIRGADILLLAHHHVRVPDEVADNPGRLKYFCGLTGSMRAFVGERHVRSGIPLTNWSVPTPEAGMSVAEGALALLLAMLHDIHARVQHVRRGGGKLDPAGYGGRLFRLDVGVYGCGLIGRRFIDLIRPFGPTLLVYDPFVRNLPEGCLRADSLETLFRRSKAVVIHAGLTDATRGSVTRDLLAMLPDHAVIVNTARGGIIDQDALFDELRSGRLRAGLDVLEPDNLPEGHEARQWENLVWTAHNVSGAPWPTGGAEPAELNNFQQICVDNLRRFVSGEPLQGTMNVERFRLST
ncbi:MAG: hypothetical protein JXR37_20380 [Kiritimatiellae bacterium]|nr:hypothetical protein [Kiritimatiellia bacterium]